MIRKIKIRNFKSIRELSLPLGRITVLIGENGSGKSNILEAVALGAAAANNKLDNEFLYSRGIRVTQNPAFMRAAFDSPSTAEKIVLSFAAGDGTDYDFTLFNDNKPYSGWSELFPVKPENSVAALRRLQDLIASGHLNLNEEVTPGVWRRILRGQIDSEVFAYLEEFLIYSPENSILRSPDREGQIQPLGIRGEGLFRYLQHLSSDENKSRLADIKQRMKFLEWFRDFAISDESPESEARIEIQDKYVAKDVGALDQLSANEGFLIILFYFALLVGSETPRFLAIDNVDNALNPKLCTRLMKEIVGLAKKYEKHLLLTTHNPAILDGLNLDDDEQRLYVVYRTKVGETKLKRVLKPKEQEGVEPVRLSEAFLRGYIGGLPRNF